jgi:hypothetical protein
MSDYLDENATDALVTAVKVGLGAVPVFGSLIAELAGTVIPNQRIDRIVDFARQVEIKAGKVDQEMLRVKLTDANFTDMMEETVTQAARAVSSERREYLASILASGVSDTHVTAIETRHLLRILGEINDIEVIWLRYYSHRLMSGDEEFRTKHAAIIEPVRAHMGSDQETLDRLSLQKNYLEHLASLGLLFRPLQLDQRTKLPVYDPSTKSWGTRAAEATPFARLLLRQIGLLPTDE